MLARIGGPDAGQQPETTQPLNGLARAALLVALTRGGQGAAGGVGGSFAQALALATRQTAGAARPETPGSLATALSGGLASLGGDGLGLDAPGGEPGFLAGGLSAGLVGRYLAQARQAARTASADARPGVTAPSAPGATASGSAGPVQHINQMDPREYDSAEQARVWGGSTCSAASLTMVLRSRGLDVKIADVMKAMPGAITPQLGLVSRPGLVAAAQKFGLGARDDVVGYDALQQATAAGQTVLVDVTNKRFPEGHWIVVTGADSQGVTIADSSGYRLTSLSRAEFQAAWSGKGIRLAGGPTSAPSRLGPTGG
jgi:uncharacterized protein YvpB